MFSTEYWRGCPFQESISFIAREAIPDLGYLVCRTTWYRSRPPSVDPQVIRGIESGALYASIISVVACDGIHQSKLNKTLNSQQSKMSTFLVISKYPWRAYSCRSKWRGRSSGGASKVDENLWSLGRTRWHRRPATSSSRPEAKFLNKEDTHLFFWMRSFLFVTKFLR